MDVMQDEKIPAAKTVFSCLTEALARNVPKAGFGRNTYSKDERLVMAQAFNNTVCEAKCKEVIDACQFNELAGRNPALDKFV